MPLINAAMRLFGYPLAIIRILLMLTLMIVFILGYFVFTLFFLLSNERRSFRLRKLYVHLAAWIMGIKVEKSGEIHNEPALYVCNHRTFSDPVVVSKFLNAYVIAKAEVADMPILHQGAKLTGIIYVQRNDADSRKNAREEMIQTLLEGRNVLIYPEGTTHAEKRIKEYRPGSFIEAAKNDIPVVPIVLEYKQKEALWFGHNLTTQFFRQLAIPRIHTKICFGPAMKDRDGLVLRDQVVEWSNEKIAEMHEGWGSVFSA